MNESTPTFKRNVHHSKLFPNITPIPSIEETYNKGSVTKSKRKINLENAINHKKKKNENNEYCISAPDYPTEQLNNSLEDLFLSEDELILEEITKENSVDVIKTATQSNLKQLEERSINKSGSVDIFSLENSKLEGDSLIREFHMDSAIALNLEKGRGNTTVLEESFTGLSRIFNETMENPNEGSMLDVMKRKLLENAKNVPEAGPCSTGWTQFQGEFSDTFQLEGSQYHELGPYYGLPSKVKDLIEKYKGIKDLYAWQDECLNLPAIKERKNLVYALPTSGGKTLVAEILILREILCCSKNVLFVLPFVAIVQEKVRSLSPLAIDLNFLVEEYAAGKGTMPPRRRRRKNTIMVCTIEKALAVVQSLIEAKRLSELGLVVVDELHLLAEGSGRGAALESLIAHLMFSRENIHIVGMSATIGNLFEVAAFLKAETYTGDFRPVELTEYVKCGEAIYRVDWKADDIMVPVRNVTSAPGPDVDGISLLVREVCPTESVLVFCATKRNCENIAVLLTKQLPREFSSHRSAEKKSLMAALTSELNGRMCPVLKESIKFGVAYHHSGLTGDERKLIEDSYRDGVICCICCTSTLAAGVNLPAKRVILRSPYVGREFINLSKYKQMVGRAGRAGLGACGESFLICQPRETVKVGELLRSKMDDAVSALTVENCKDLILSAIGLGIANTRETLRKFLQKTLLHVQAKRRNVDVMKITDDCIRELCKTHVLRIGEVQKIEPDVASTSHLEVSVNLARDPKPKRKVRITNQSPLSVSRIGRAAMKGCMSLPIAVKLYEDLLKAESSLFLRCSLHILYLVTPYQISGEVHPNFAIFFDVYMQLSEQEQQAAKTIGLSENHMSRMAMGQRPKNLPEELVNRFYITLIINELWKQQSVWEVATLFQIPRGQVQSLMSSAASFSWNVLRFCEELEELWSVKALLSEFAPRLAHCCESDILPLMDLPGIKRARARQLYNAGFKTLQIIAKAEPKDLVNAIEFLSTRNATQIITTAKLLLLEKVENLKEEVEDVMDDLKEPKK